MCAIVMRDHSLQLLRHTLVSLVRISDLVDEYDALKTQHLFEVDIASSVPIDAIETHNIRCAIAVAFDDRARFRSFAIIDSDMQENSVGGAIQNCISLLSRYFEAWWEFGIGEGLAINAGVAT